ncbi:Tango6 [Drosophila busckii]|uniref:Tango6 n=1 Tax=Drosophila busckii TaxID=30019 RepID=A0A0M3QT87_DROBS|nr:Tango6 [Drosophila busckii]
MNVARLDTLSAAVLSLRRLYELNAQNRQQIEHILYEDWQPLLAPEDLLSGIIIWQQSELSERLQLWQQLFCSSSVACLPCELLVQYLPLLLQLYQQLPSQQSLTALITRCLDNREVKLELPALLQRLFSWQLVGEPTWQALHARIVLLPAADTDYVTAKVAPVDSQQPQEICRVLPTLLMACPDHALSCKVFLALLSLIVEQLDAAQSAPQAADLLSCESELAQFLQNRYQLKLELLLALQQLVCHAPLKSQLALEQSKPFIAQIAKLLRLCQHPEAEQTLLLLLLLLSELLERNEQLQHADCTQRLRLPLQQLAASSKNVLLKQALQPLLQLLVGDIQADVSIDIGFQRAPIRSKDATFLAQRHRIIALALATLKHKESYTFLNCVRLFAALVHVMEAEVLEMLSDEYLAETAELDYRLVVGEAILKAAQELGPLCYRYKSVLLNCFLHGARSSLDEFRSSAYANLAQLCRLLSYQVHSFFQELLQLIDNELSTGRYLPAKRGALLVLAELLAGMVSLLDHQELLLPIYRLLRAIESAESCDSQMRQHAANGLKTLNEKCRELLSKDPMEQMQQEIRVFGIKEPQAGKRGHILELN